MSTIPAWSLSNGSGWLATSHEGIGAINLQGGAPQLEDVIYIYKLVDDTKKLQLHQP